MRFTGYMRTKLDTGARQFCTFEPDHFKTAGIAPQASMPVLEAFQLVNHFNKVQGDQPGFLYWLEA